MGAENSSVFRNVHPTDGYGLEFHSWGVGLGSLSCPVVRVVLNTGHVPQTTSRTPVILRKLFPSIAPRNRAAATLSSTTSSGDCVRMIVKS